jgi:hypothetical protein
LDLPRFRRPFGTADLAVILGRITKGLSRAAVPEARLCRRAARGRDLTPAPIRVPTGREQCAAWRSAQPDAQLEPQAADPTEDPRLARLPTEAEIAAEVRRRPVGADICHDLGLMPGQCDRAFWHELSEAIIVYGGSLAGFLPNPNTRRLALGSGYASHADPTWPAAPPRLPTHTTGPP